MPIAKKSDISKEFLNQIKSNLSKDSLTTDEEPESEEVPVAVEPVEVIPETKTEAAAEEVKPEQKIEPQTASEDKKEKYADVMNVRLSKGRRNEIKTFCTSCGISVTQYIETSFEYLAKEVAAGRLVISKGGITKKED